MKYNMLQEAAKINKEHRRTSLWRRIVSILAAVVVFTTTYALILPALTLETDNAEQNGVYIKVADNFGEEAAPAPEEDTATASPEKEEPAIPAEQEEKVETPAAPEKPEQTEGVLVKVADEMPAQKFEGETEDVKVSVKANKGAFPVGTTMEVTAVEDAEIISAVKKTVKDEIKQLKIVDITFKNAKGEEIEPAAKIRVKLTSDVIKNGKAPVVVHIDDKGKGDIVNQLTEKKLGEKPAEDEIYFDSEEFSVYAIVETYTVDFHYMDFDFSIDGDSKIYLSELFKAIGVSEKIADVASVEFTNPELIKIEKKKSDWLLTSLKSFKTDEVLTVTMKNGTVYVIDVKDPPSYSMSLVTGVSSTLDSIMLHMIDGLTEDNFSIDNVVVNNNDGHKLFFDPSTLAIRANQTIASSENISLDVTYSYLDENNDPVTETINIAVHSEDPPEGEVVHYVETSIMHGTHYEDPALNDWQAVEERYAGNRPGNKIVSEDKYVRVQKNVIPTGIENEFYVYLGVDVSQGAVLERIVSGIGTVYTPSNPMPNYGDIWGSNNASKANNAMVTGKDGNMRGFVLEPTPTCNKKWTLRFNLPSGEVITATRWAEFDSFNNGHLVMKISGNPQPHGTWITVGRAAKAQGTGPDGSYISDITLDQHAIDMILSYYGADVDLGAVIDQMGGQSITEVVTQTYTQLDGATVTPGSYVIVDGEEGEAPQLNWDVGTLHLFGATDDGYYTNVAELLYKVTLDVMAPGFVSGEDYDVNRSATLAYSHGNGDSGTVAFPKPKIQGTTYNFEFTKMQEVDGVRDIMPDVKFNIELSGNPDITSLPQSLTQVKSDENGKVSFTGLPWGTYTLTEEVPDGFRTVGPWIMNIGYTTDLADGTITEHDSNLTTPSAFPGIYIGNPLKQKDDGHGGYEYVLEDCWTGSGSSLTLVNKRNTITVNKTIDVYNPQGIDPDDELKREDIEHTIIIALRLNGQKDENNNDIYLTDSNGNIITKEITISGGELSPNNGYSTNGKVEFGISEDIPTGVYDVMELKAINGSSVSRLSVGDVFINSNDEMFQVRSIVGSSININEEGDPVYAGNNNADLTYSNTSEVSFVNTYSHVTEMNYTVKKAWMSKDVPIDAPEGASVVFRLYQYVEVPDTDPVEEGVRYYYDHENNKYRVTPYLTNGEYTDVPLDGSVDSNFETENGNSDEIDDTGEYRSWEAKFAHLPLYANEAAGIKYQYLVQEVDCVPDDFKPYASSGDETPMGPNSYEDINGGTIWNKQNEVEITVKKVDDKDEFLAGSKFKLFKVVEGSPDEWIGAEVEIDSADGKKFEGLVTGDYRLVETKAPEGYIILTNTIDFHVDSSGKRPIITWPNGQQPENAYLNDNSDTVTITNIPGEALPMTGGNGKTIYTLGGLALMGGALVYGFGLRRRRERRFNE